MKQFEQAVDHAQGGTEPPATPNRRPAAGCAAYAKPAVIMSGRCTLPWVAKRDPG